MIAVDSRHFSGSSSAFDGSGHADTTPAARASSGSIAERVSDRMNRARPADADFDDLASPDSAEDNVEIPAFLRRQAN